MGGVRTDLGVGILHLRGGPESVRDRDETGDAKACPTIGGGRPRLVEDAIDHPDHLRNAIAIQIDQRPGDRAVPVAQDFAVRQLIPEVGGADPTLRSIDTADIEADVPVTIPAIGVVSETIAIEIDIARILHLRVWVRMVIGRTRLRRVCSQWCS
jgi:hypothetical protein